MYKTKQITQRTNCHTIIIISLSYLVTTTEKKQFFVPQPVERCNLYASFFRRIEHDTDETELTGKCARTQPRGEHDWELRLLCARSAGTKAFLFIHQNRRRCVETRRRYSDCISNLIDEAKAKKFSCIYTRNMYTDETTTAKPNRKLSIQLVRGNCAAFRGTQRTVRTGVDASVLSARTSPGTVKRLLVALRRFETHALHLLVLNVVALCRSCAACQHIHSAFCCSLVHS